MAEMRMTTVVGAVVVVGAIGAFAAAAMGLVAIGPLNHDNIWGWFSKGQDKVTGFTPAKTQQEALDKFREAIEVRKYNYAAKYVTKEYAAALNRANEGASELGASIDRVRDYAKTKGTETDKVRFLFFLLDPFPKVLKSGPAPVEKDKKHYGHYVLEIPKATTNREKLEQELREVDFRMFQTVLALPITSANALEIVKEGEEWKLSVPINAAWEQEVAYSNDNWKKYRDALDDFKGWMLNNNNQISTKEGLETEVIETLRKAKKR